MLRAHKEPAVERLSDDHGHHITGQTFQRAAVEEEKIHDTLVTPNDCHINEREDVH